MLMQINTPIWLIAVERRAEWRRSLATLTDYLTRHTPSSLLLDVSDGLDFWLGFFAAAVAKIDVVIPPNYQPVILDGLRQTETNSLADILSRLGPLSNATISEYQTAQQYPVANISITLHTSGTTDRIGQRKAIQRRLFDLLREVQALRQSLPIHLDNAAIISTVPNHHLYGFTFRGLWAFQANLPIWPFHLEMPEQVVAAAQRIINEDGLTPILVTTPAHLSRLPDMVGLAPIQQLRDVLTAGSPFTENHAERLAAIGCYPLEIYGSTETGAIAWRRQLNSPFWQPLAGISLNAQQDAAMVSAAWIDPSISMPDHIEINPVGSFLLHGRIDRVIKLGEKRVDLNALENVLLQHPWVQEVAVCLIQRKRDALAAIVVPTAMGKVEIAGANAAAINQQLRDYLNQFFDRVLTPKYWRFIDCLPYDERGKLPLKNIEKLLATGESP
ncbi:AMP-binding protein [Parvibium lacunae]|uniref:AMP-dependent synthetase/ligase domain-containing protein n=1 Tax=Parvibium lacunae TaxID=1888893 RepID=A0A368L1R5_9BURK|nr:AMP-binding protein [Parvibium lacunae]RCS57504.1 hypothetical protein DU000_08630 [Parvibium lacunae]